MAARAATLTKNNAKFTPAAPLHDKHRIVANDKETYSPQMSHTLTYIHDPMCSWCYAFGPVWAELRAALPASLRVQRLLGGLAPDSTTPMDEAMRQRLEATWQRIEKSVPGTRFNFDFWRHATPYRSTYPSCRAVIAARAQGKQFDETMTHALQHAYYRQARNPSLRPTLIEVAAELGLDVAAFASALDAPATQARLEEEIAQTRRLGADSFPALVLTIGTSRWPVAIDYNSAVPMLDTIDFLLQEGE
ncbi:MAG: DsbA family protein [Gammaproteobacteria bacterium]|nr:DsbA family protein [Gammaproteobacteria bacterium]